MVEGGRIDHANHKAMAWRALSETVAMDLAVEEILRQVDLEDTLIIVTADHSHSVTMNGYPEVQPGIAHEHEADVLSQ